MALGWALGLIDDPAHMTPTHRDDGSALSDRERQEYGDVLRKLAEPAGTGLSA